MIIGFSDVTGKGRLTSQLCFSAGLFAQYSEKKHLIISRKPQKAEHYLGISPEEADKKRNDLLRLAVNGQLTTQLLSDYSIPLMKGLDYLDASFVEKQAGDHPHVLYEYLMEKANEGYHYVFADLGGDAVKYRKIDKFVLCLPQSEVIMEELRKEKEERLPKTGMSLLLFGSYYPESRWTKNRLTKGIASAEVLGIEFAYELFDAFQAGDLLDYLKRRYLNWEKEYKTFTKFTGGGEERRK